MINKVEVTNHLGETITMILGPTDTSNFLIKKIDGLGPARATINTNTLATADGSFYNSARLEARNIVFNIKLVGNPLVEDTRLKSYRYFPIKKQVKLTFHTDNRISTIYGYVESNEPNIFETRSEDTFISIVCPDPYFYDVGTQTVISGIDDVFEFPLENQSLSEDLLELGSLNIGQETSITYDGDADVGMEIIVTATGNVEMFTIYNTGDGKFLKIDTDKLTTLTGSVIVDGDEIRISTVRGNKYVTLYRNGVETNILNALDKDSDWLTLVRGINVIAFTATVGSSNLSITINHKTRYEGV